MTQSHNLDSTLLDSSEGVDEAVTKIEEALFGIVDSGNDHELFIASYLHGHFSLVVAQAPPQGDTWHGLLSRMDSSLKQAFADGELEAEDQKDVMQLWQQLTTQCTRT